MPLLAVGAVTQRRVNIGSSLSPEQFAEAKFYLEQYGNAEHHVAFLIRHGFFELAFATVTERKLSPALFVEAVFVPLLHHGKVEDFRLFVQRADPSLQHWLPYLAQSCRFLLSKHNARLLLELQVLMGDFFRAGLSCISLACQTQLTLEQRVQQLESARVYFDKGAQESLLVLGDSSGLSDGPRLQMSKREIQKHVDIIALQEELFKFFDVESNNATLSQPLRLRAVQATSLSLFAGQEQQVSLAAEVLVIGSDVSAAFTLAFKIVQVLLQTGQQVYSTALCELARLKMNGKVAEVIKFVKPAVDDTTWDMVILDLIGVFRSEQGDAKMADQYSQVIKSDATKIEALIKCGRLKNAYLIAVKTATAVAYVRRIRDASVEMEGNHVITSLCDGYLREHDA